MLRTTQHGHEAGRLLEHFAKALTLSRRLPVLQDLLGSLGADDQYTSDPSRCRLVVDGAVAIGPVNVLPLPVAGDRDQMILVPGRAAASHHLLDLWADDRPDLFPDLAPGLAERSGVPFRSDRTGISVVVEASKFGAPPDIHRMPGVQDEPQNHLERLRPTCGRTERSAGPVVGAHEPTHLAAAGQEARPLWTSVRFVLPHRPRVLPSRLRHQLSRRSSPLAVETEPGK